MKTKSYLTLVNKQYETLYLLALVHAYNDDLSDQNRQYAKELLSYLIAFSISKKLTTISDQRMILRIETLEQSKPNTN